MSAPPWCLVLATFIGLSSSLCFTWPNYRSLCLLTFTSRSSTPHSVATASFERWSRHLIFAMHLSVLDSLSVNAHVSDWSYASIINPPLGFRGIPWLTSRGQFLSTSSMLLLFWFWQPSPPLPHTPECLPDTAEPQFPPQLSVIQFEHQKYSTYSIYSVIL